MGKFLRCLSLVYLVFIVRAHADTLYHFVFNKVNGLTFEVEAQTYSTNFVNIDRVLLISNNQYVDSDCQLINRAWGLEYTYDYLCDLNQAAQRVLRKKKLKVVLKVEPIPPGFRWYSLQTKSTLIEPKHFYIKANLLGQEKSLIYY